MAAPSNRSGRGFGKKAASAGVDAENGAADNVAHDMITLGFKAIPFMAIGALAGGVFKMVYEMADSQRSKSMQHVSGMFKEYPYIAGDPSVANLASKIQLFTCVNPQWLPNFLDHLNFISRAWHRMENLVQQAKMLIPEKQNTSLSLAGLGGFGDSSSSSSTTTDYKSPVSFLADLFAPPKNPHSPQYASASSSYGGNYYTGSMPNPSQSQQQEQYGGNSSSSSSSPPYASTSGTRPRTEKALEDKMKKFSAEYAEASRKMNDILAEANKIWEAALVSRIAIASLCVEFGAVVAFFNCYWSQVGDIVMSDPNLHLPEHAKAMNQHKLQMVKDIMRTGRLPFAITDLPENSTTEQFLRWWISMHTMFQPTMYTVSQILKWPSIFNPVNEDVTSPLYTDGIRTNTVNGAASVGANGKNKTAPSKDATIIVPGHTFKQSKRHLTEQLEMQKRGLALQNEMQKKRHDQMMRKQLQSPQQNVTRPTKNSSFFKQLQFLARRIQGEGVWGVIKQPLAGFAPAIDESGHLSTVRMNLDDLQLYMEQIKAIIDHKVEDMSAANVKLFQISAHLQQHWHPGAFDELARKEAQKAIQLQSYWDKLAQ